jgi:hypothetical protein
MNSASGLLPSHGDHPLPRSGSVGHLPGAGLVIHPQIESRVAVGKKADLAGGPQLLGRNFCSFLKCENFVVFKLTPRCEYKKPPSGAGAKYSVLAHRLSW